MMLDTLPQPNRAFRWAQADIVGPPGLVCVALEPFADHVFTTRLWALGAPGAPDAAWHEVASALGVDTAHLVRVRQVHAAAVVVHRPGDRAPSTLPDADILVTGDAASAIAVQSADCVPLLLVDRRSGGVSAAHAGWRGLAAGVPARAVAALREEFGASPADVLVAVGPSISGPRYEVGADVRDRFERSHPSTAVARWFAPGDREHHWYFDGWQAARDALESAGVPADQIFSADLCTATHRDLLCSYRRDGAGIGRMAAAIRPRTRRP